MLQDYELMKDSKYVIVPCQISLCDYEDDNLNDSLKLEKWEHERLIEQKKEFSGANEWEPIKDCDELEQALVVYPEENIESVTENSSDWRKIRFEDDIIIDVNDMMYTSEYCMQQLTHEYAQRYMPKENEKFYIPLRFPKPLRRTVLDLYPISVKQNANFIKMDRRLFPIIPPESDSISKTLQTASSFMKITNGEKKQRINLDFELNISLSSEKGRLFLYETSEQHSPYRMQPGLSSLLAAYSNSFPNESSQIGVCKLIKRISPFFGGLSDDIPFQLALENKYFRVPVYQHSMKSTDFLLIFTGSRWKIRRFDGILLAGKQMPLKRIYHPKSPFFHDMMMRVIVQLFIDLELVPVDVLASILSNVDFLNIESDLHKIAQLTSDKRFWKLKPEQENQTRNKCFYGKVKIDDYMIWSSILSYLTSYDYIQSDKRLKKKEKKKEHKNSSSPWSISKSYLNGIQKGFWKLGNFESPTGKNQMDSFLFVRSLVPKRIISKTDLRKLTVYQTQKLLQKFEFTGNNLKHTNKRRWDLVNQLSTLAATDLKGNVDMEKYARETKPNRRLLRKKYIQQCKEMFEHNRKILSNPKEAVSESELNDDILKAETKEITIEDFRKYLKETNDNSKNEVLPVISNQENVKKLVENPLKYFVIYRKKDGVVKKEIYPVTEYVLNYLKHSKSGRFGKKLYGLGDLAKREKQQLRDKLRRQEKYKKKRLEMNLPVEFDSQDTTDKICSSCGRKGHIRTNQECPNFDKPIELVKQESSNSAKLAKSMSKKQDSLVSSCQIENSFQENSEKKVPVKRNRTHSTEKNNSSKRFKLNATNFKSQRKSPNNQTSLKRSIDQVKEKYSNIERQKPNSMSKEKKCKNYKSLKESDDEFNIEFTIKSSPKKRKPRTKKTALDKQSICNAIVGPNEDEPIIFQKDDSINPVAQPIDKSSDSEYTIDFNTVQTAVIDDQNHCDSEFELSSQFLEQTINDENVINPNDVEDEDEDIDFPIYWPTDI